MNESVVTLARASGLVFAVASMLALGLTLTMPGIRASVRTTHLVLAVLVADFIVAPVLAVVAARIIPASHQDLRTGLILLGAAAGAPLLARLVQMARGRRALATGATVLGVVITLAYIPLVLPVLLPSSLHLGAGRLAEPLLVLIALPFVLGLVVRTRHEGLASSSARAVGVIAAVGFALLAATVLLVNFRQLEREIGSHGLGAAIVFLVGCFLVGYALSSGPAGTRPVLSLGTPQRSLPAAVAVAAVVFAGQPLVLAMVTAVGVLGLAGVTIGAAEAGRRATLRMLPVVDDPDQARQIAEEAWVYTYPMIEMHRVITELTLAPHLPSYLGPINTLHHQTELPDETFSVVVSPTRDTLHSLAVLDLRTEPFVLSVPALPRRRYYSFAFISLDSQVFGYVGTRATGISEGHYLIAGPHWDGEVPEEIAGVLRSETDIVMARGRTMTSGPEDVPTVVAIQHHYQLQPLSSFLRIPAPEPVGPPLDLAHVPPVNPRGVRSAEFIGLANWLLSHIAPHASEADLLARFSRIGLASGAPFYLDALPESTRDAIEEGVKAGMEAVADKAKRLGRQVNGWQMLPNLYGTRADLQNDYLRRAAAAVVGLLGNPAYEALYPVTYADSAGVDLNGAGGARYELRFPSTPPVHSLWTLTAYRLPERMFVPNAERRYLVGSMTPDLVSAPDGSLTIYLQQDAPDDSRLANWLPIPDGPFYLILRLYWPKGQVLDGTYAPPGVSMTAERVINLAAEPGAGAGVPGTPISHNGEHAAAGTRSPGSD